MVASLANAGCPHENRWSPAGPAVLSCSFSTEDTGGPPAPHRYSIFISLDGQSVVKRSEDNVYRAQVRLDYTSQQN